MQNNTILTTAEHSSCLVTSVSSSRCSTIIHTWPMHGRIS